MSLRNRLRKIEDKNAARGFAKPIVLTRSIYAPSEDGPVYQRIARCSIIDGRDNKRFWPEEGETDAAFIQRIFDATGVRVSQTDQGNRT